LENAAATVPQLAAWLAARPHVVCHRRYEYLGWQQRATTTTTAARTGRGGGGSGGGTSSSGPILLWWYAPPPPETSGYVSAEAERYNEVERIERIRLPPISFLSLHNFLEHLLLTFNINVFDDSNLLCTFSEYVGSRTSHKKMKCEPSLVENEIGGYILGSLAAARNRRPLTRQEYLNEIRSNIPRDSDDGLRKRGLFYNEFAKYQTYKEESGKHDLDDIVLRLIGEDMESEIFQSGM
jgi:hypothetical protein